MTVKKAFVNFYTFFRDGFTNMTWGRTLWLIVLVKLFVMFCILKPIFFPNFLNSMYDTDQEKAHHVGIELTSRAK